MAKVGAPEALIVKGKRLDSRELDEMRKMAVEVGMLRKAGGSASFSFGNTYAIAGAFGPREMHPKWMQEPTKAVLRCRYFMAPFSTVERIRPGISRRGTEISKVITEALSQVVFEEDFPKTGIDVFIEILQADASTRCAGLNAASLALADAGIPMADLVCSCSVGKVDGELALDISGLEDNFGDVDMAVATIGNGDRFVLLQMDGIITREEFSRLLELSRQGCAAVFDAQKKALKKRYMSEVVEDERV